MTTILKTSSGHLIVTEGASRLLWSRRTDGSWRLARIWPDRHEKEEVLRHLRDGGCLLILLDLTPTVLTAFPDELDDVAVVRGHRPDESLVELTVPFLDWLPERYRHEARRFQAAVQARSGEEPAVLQAPLAVSPASAASPNVRFAVRSRAYSGHSPEQLADLADHLFGGSIDDEEARSAHWLTRLVPMPWERAARSLLNSRQLVGGGGHV
ncbi:hypothetical protein [Sinomonas sp. G460-2]|uniref:hypothetical protein n=1 Tax=Sinomonas sp. G460-2 TaxID=3393464 RepID=UPI0039EF4A82